MPFKTEKKLSASQIDKLQQLFNALDEDKRGKLDIEQVRRLGLAMLGEKPKIEDVKYQIAQADLDGDGCLDFEEWLAYSQVLAKLPSEKFDRLMDKYTSKVLMLIDTGQ